MFSTLSTFSYIFSSTTYPVSCFSYVCYCSQYFVFNSMWSKRRGIYTKRTECRPIKQTLEKMCMSKRTSYIYQQKVSKNQPHKFDKQIYKLKNFQSMYKSYLKLRKRVTFADANITNYPIYIYIFFIISDNIYLNVT